MIGHLSLGLNGQRPFGMGRNGCRPPETGGHLTLLQRNTYKHIGANLRYQITSLTE